MLARVPDQAFERFRQIDNRRYFLVVAIQRCQFFGLLESALQCNAEVERHQFGNPVDKSVGLTQYAPGVPNHCFGRHRPERNDLRNSIAPVAIGHIIDHPVAALHAEVDIEIRHGNALGV